ncbi:MbnP family protein [Pelobium manganitolerans]|uniref:MbnP family protein n=1 Tax=Pelobium manganitolerans TaxID=1842495 RepID=UPI003FA35538
MNTLKKYSFLILALSVFVSCKKDKDPVANNINLHFNNTFKDKTIVLGDAASSTATVNASANGQVHHFSELKYVISNIRLIKADGTAIPYNINNLDEGATVINQAKAQSLDYVLGNIPVGEYKQIKFGLGVKADLNTLNEAKFPKFYAAAGANDTKMMWEWGAGYRFTKIEGFYDTDNKTLSIHTGSTVEGTNGDEATYTQGVDAYRDITLSLPKLAVVGKNAPKITIKADFDKLLSGKTNTIALGDDNAVPSVHTAVNMVKYVDNLGGNGTSDLSGMFSIASVEN